MSPLPLTTFNKRARDFDFPAHKVFRTLRFRLSLGTEPRPFDMGMQDPLAVQNTRKSFVPGGKYSAKDKKTQRKASTNLLKERLIATLKADVPRSFVRCFEDDMGLIVCMFAEGPDSQSDVFAEELGRYPELDLSQMIHTPSLGYLPRPQFQTLKDTMSKF